MSTIGLSMIVRDEAHVVLRCLESARSLIDGAVIVDTGSRDGTPDLLRAYFAQHGIPASVIAEPWRDFAHNRSSALAALRRVPGLDYALVLDADDSLILDAGFDAAAFKAALSADVYDVEIRHGGTVYRRPQIFSNRLAFRYRSVLHEYLDIPASARTRAFAAGLGILYGGDGARSRDPATYARDARLLEAALKAETDPALRARYTFYLAQSYRDCGQAGAALENYLRRADLGHWEQEVFESLLNAGCILAQQGAPIESVLPVLERATAAVPERAEGLHAAARICRERGAHALGLAAAERGLGLPRPEAGLFLRPWVYETGLLDEYAVNAYWTGRDIDCLVACAILLARPDLDADMRGRVSANRDFALRRLGAQASLWLDRLADGAPRIAVVTSYRGQSPETLRRCIDSVRRQTVAADHILVPEERPQDWLDAAGVRHLALGPGGAGGDGAARALGGLMAASAGYAAIGFLDAACWYDDDHLERCLTAALALGFDRCGGVAASRRFHRPDLSVMPLRDEDPAAFIDASCYLLLPAGFGLIGRWALMPAALAPVADRLFFLGVRAGDLVLGRTRCATVNCLATYAVAYAALGEAPPANARALPDHAGHRAWIEALAPDAIETIRRQIGVDVRDLYPPGEGAASQASA